MHDWIVIGAGITGAALAYELAKQHFSVLLIDQSAQPESATRLSYGGIAYWSGTTELTTQLCGEGLAIHRSLCAELDADTQFRELDLLLTISSDYDPDQIATNYAQFAIPPTLLTINEAWELEPLLNRDAIAGALTVNHGHIEPEVTTQAYCQAFQRLGGDLKIAHVAHLQKTVAKITGVITPTETFSAKNVAVCTGGVTRQFLNAAKISVNQYFTHAELLETPPVDLRLRTLVMPAEAERFALEANATCPDVEALWDVPGNEPAPAILDAGAVQFLDGRIRIGQVSRTLTDAAAQVNAAQSEAVLRQKIGQILPKLGTLSGTWHHCLIAFSRDRLPLIGEIEGYEGLHLFSGFSNPLAIVPPLARRFAAHATGQRDPLLAPLSPSRFM
ncbi:NAD(P)/FAD-dependent oxidoreductase [Myxacorys almedinensis]|uniref:FAD-dependent oxidoreductase n=1 Tax=Myxacorys almedinensis A TaxID=2690445 RepID=A0A8J7Z2H4_9CYAN|nr:FAD-binding oxidoreductase [Myxacorys almedinensis]NDJ16601.1 FAD-dependent oxidoreductase [Myxacorys almedinensis A]